MNFLKFISRKGKKLVDLPQDARVFGYVGKANVENYNKKNITQIFWKYSRKKQ